MNTFISGSESGEPQSPTLRTLVPSDLPSILNEEEAIGDSLPEYSEAEKDAIIRAAIKLTQEFTPHSAPIGYVAAFRALQRALTTQTTNDA